MIGCAHRMSPAGTSEAGVGGRVGPYRSNNRQARCCNSVWVCDSYSMRLTGLLPYYYSGPVQSSPLVVSLSPFRVRLLLALFAPTLSPHLILIRGRWPGRSTIPSSQMITIQVPGPQLRLRAPLRADVGIGTAGRDAI